MKMQLTTKNITYIVVLIICMAIFLISYLGAGSNQSNNSQEIKETGIGYEVSPDKVEEFEQQLDGGGS